MQALLHTLVVHNISENTFIRLLCQRLVVLHILAKHFLSGQSHYRNINIISILLLL